MSDLRFEGFLPAELVDEVVAEVTRRVLEAVGPPVQVSPYLTIAEAAEFLRCSEQRIRDLLSQRKLKRFKEGGTRDNPRSGRTLVLRAEVEAQPWESK